MKRKALFFDIDGTLLSDHKKELPESAARVIAQARRAGHLVFINSGRARCLMQEVEAALPVDGYLCGCGTYLEIQKSILAHDLDGILEGPEGCAVQSQVSRLEEMERVKELFIKSGVVRPWDWKKEAAEFDKFCVLADEKSDVDGFLRSLAPDMAYIDRGRGLYECVPAGYDKATAMEFILKYFRIPREESYAFGDSANDLAMIQYAGHSVIMGQHDRILEPYASFITKNVEDDGIAFAFEKLKIV